MGKFVRPVTAEKIAVLKKRADEAAALLQKKENEFKAAEREKRNSHLYILGVGVEHLWSSLSEETRAEIKNYLNVAKGRNLERAENAFAWLNENFNLAQEAASDEQELPLMNRSGPESEPAPSGYKTPDESIF
jgi:hypothetical protein